MRAPILMLPMMKLPLLPTLRLLVLSCCLLAAAGAAQAGRLVEVAVLDRDSGELLPVHWHDGQAYVAGSPGHRYSIRLDNRTGRRLLAVLSVDGVNAVSGETADADQAGYVLAPWSGTSVDGWRKSLSEVAAFEFTALHASYAARTGRPANVGVIGVAVFEERRWRTHEDIAQASPEHSRAPRPQSGAPATPYAGDNAAKSHAESLARSDAGAAAQARAPADADTSERGLARRGEPLGTGHGAREWSTARRTTFERASAQPAEVVAIRYDSWANLADAGIVPRRWPRLGQRDPQPFPGGFVPDP